MIKLSELRGKRTTSTGVVYALCPFHNERTASFRVKNGQGFCFGCGCSEIVVDDWSVSPDQLSLPFKELDHEP